MKNYKSNLKERKIVLSVDDMNMVLGIVKRKLQTIEPYPQLNGEIQEILVNNVLIVATTDNVKRLDAKVDTIIKNLNEAISLVMEDVRLGSQLEE